ncbi:hypothetical protein K2173_017088 [Erythroxylum novogranatense]|uniref:Nodulin-related protein 1 n=1 Tax=Erythroxylum novogranatense TaxID=1862640 RepID=A0AAV8U5P4_9ROSI|nr:hypothetical protein K2173_017088 [Erythroxylum novogranatense]
MEPTDSSQKSSSGLFSSAKLVAEAAQSTLRHDTDNLDKGKVTTAAADLLDAGQKYGKLDENKGIGSYVEKAEGYLRQYNPSKAPTAEKTQPPHQSHGDSEGGEEKKSEGGHGDYLKMAQGFLKTEESKPSSHESEGGEEKKAEGGYGGYLKMAEGFLKKN